MKFQDKLDALNKSITAGLPKDVAEIVSEENRKILSMYLEEKALKINDQAPDALFYSQEFEEVHLKDLLKDRNIVISFYRGSWCPYCDAELQELSKYYDEIKKCGADLIAVSPELIKYTKGYVESHTIEYNILFDMDNIAADLFGLVFELPEGLREIYRRSSLDLGIRNGNEFWVLPMPATFIISKDGIIRSTFVNADYTKRMEPEDILAELDKLIK